MKLDGDKLLADLVKVQRACASQLSEDELIGQSKILTMVQHERIKLLREVVNFIKSGDYTIDKEGE